MKRKRKRHSIVYAIQNISGKTVGPFRTYRAADRAAGIDDLVILTSPDRITHRRRKRRKTKHKRTR